MAANSCKFTVVWDPACSGRVCVWMGEFAHPIWEFIWKLTTIAGIGGGGALPSSVGRSASAMVKCGPKLLVPVLGPGGGVLRQNSCFGENGLFVCAGRV